MLPVPLPEIAGRAQHARVIAEPGKAHVRPFPQQRFHFLPECRIEKGLQDRMLSGDPAADDDPVRVQDPAERNDPHGPAVHQFRQDLPQGSVSSGDEGKKGPSVELVRMIRPYGCRFLQQSRHRSPVFPGTGGSEPRLADFAGGEGAAAVEPPVEEDRTTDARADGHHEELAGSLAGSVMVFGKGRAVHVIFHAHRQARLLSQDDGQIDPVQSREILGGTDQLARPAVDHSGERNGDPRDFFSRCDPVRHSNDAPDERSSPFRPDDIGQAPSGEKPALVLFIRKSVFDGGAPHIETENGFHRILLICSGCTRWPCRSGPGSFPCPEGP